MFARPIGFLLAIGRWRPFLLTGVVFGQKTYDSFAVQDAAGLAPQSVVPIKVFLLAQFTRTPEAGWVAVEAKINDRSLKLPAKAPSGSLLGGDPQVALDTQATIPVR